MAVGSVKPRTGVCPCFNSLKANASGAEPMYPELVMTVGLRGAILYSKVVHFWSQYPAEYQISSVSPTRGIRPVCHENQLRCSCPWFNRLYDAIVQNRSWSIVRNNDFGLPIYYEEEYKCVYFESLAASVSDITAERQCQYPVTTLRVSC